MPICTFCGHGDIPYADRSELQEKVYAVVEELINSGVGEFFLGGYGDFDKLCAKTVHELKSRYPHISSVLVIPYPDREYNTELYDSTLYPPIEKTPRRFAILERNKYMADKADVIVAFIKYGFGGAAKTYEYAVKKKKRVINIAEK